MKNFESLNTSYDNCLVRLLEALHWRGNAFQVKEALPYYSKIINIMHFINVMENLNFDSQSFNVETNYIDSRLLPCLFISRTGEVLVLLKLENNILTLYSGITKKETNITKENFFTIYETGTLYSFQEKQFDKKKISSNWLKKLLFENKALIYNSILLSFFINILSLAIPLFIMAVYDSVIPSRSYYMLSYFSVGVILSLLGISIMTRSRSQLIAIIGSKIEKNIGDYIFSKLLYLPVSYTESVSVGAQVARISDFDRVREFISGPLMGIFFEFPFIVISLTVIAILGGLLVLIPIIMLIILLVLSLFVAPGLKEEQAMEAKSTTEFHEFLLESLCDLRVIKYTASENIWKNRFRKLSAKINLANISRAIANELDSAIAEFILIGSGLAVLGFGAVMVMHRKLGVGALIAIMILTWRSITPMKIIFSTLPRLLQISSSFKQINRLMQVKTENDNISGYLQKKQFKGDISFYNVSMRYYNAPVPTLLGVNFEIKAGSLVGIIGKNGSGKSTLLKLLLGLYQTQTGFIRIDNQDIRQISPIDLRRSIAYLPQKPQLFYGSIASNLRLVDPNAQDEELERAAEMAGILAAIKMLPEGFQTYIKDQSRYLLSSSFLQSICLARAYLRQSTILLLDEPSTTLDEQADKKLMEKLKDLKGKSTVIMITHRPSHIALMDKILLLDNGHLVLQGDPKLIMNKIPKHLL